jgi:hypothetical protein
LYGAIEILDGSAGGDGGTVGAAGKENQAH